MKISENSFRTDFYLSFTKYLKLHLKYYWFITIILKDAKIADLIYFTW